jgi:hypothetical protein
MADANNSILLTKTLDPEILIFGKHKDRSATVYYPTGVNDYDKMRIQTPKMKIVFDPQERKDRNGSIFVLNLSHSLEAIGSDKNKSNIELFESKMKRVERVVQKILPPDVISGREKSSSFWQKGDYASTIRSSVKYMNGDPQIRIFMGKNREPVDVSELKRGAITSCIFCLDQVWVTKDKYGINWVVEQIVIYPEKSSTSTSNSFSIRDEEEE